MQRELTEDALRKSLDQLSANVVHDPEYWGLRAIAMEPAPVALDVGANRGQSIVSLKVLFPDIVVHAFEANPLFHDCLTRLAASIGDSVRVHPYGLGRADERLVLHVPYVGDEPYFEEATTRPEQFAKPWIAAMFRARGDVRLEECIVPVRRGDDLELSPAIIKIDVEGAELDVLQGLRGTITRSLPALLIENSDWDGVTPFLSELGYEPFRWEPELERLVPYYGRSANSLYLHGSRAPARTVRSASVGAPTTGVVDRTGDESTSRMRILVANFFPAFDPPRSGGEQRYHRFYRQLSRHCDVTLLSPTFSSDRFEQVSFSPRFRELRVPKEPAFDRLHWLLDAQGIGPECSGYVVAVAAGVETEYSRRFADAVADADVVIHECPFTLPYDRSFGVDGKPRIYNAYNVEHRLARQMLRGEAGAKASEFIRFLEGALARNAALVFATSDEDRTRLASDFDLDVARILLVPNGFEPDDAAEGFRGVARHPARVLFMGSAHPPNVEAARFIAERLAPALPGVEFRLLGAAGAKIGGDVPPNVRILGIVDEASRRRELATCTIAVNPMFAGSGTNLKVLDYLAAGAPVVTTPVGARGLPLVDGETAVIADADGFADRLRAVLADAEARVRVGEAGRARAYADFTWDRIADSAYAAIEAMLATQRQARGAPRPLLLVVNDFPVGRRVGGGEVRIRELLLELGREFDVVLLCLTQGAHRSEARIAAHVREIRIPKTAAHRDAEVLAARGETVSIDDVLAAEYCAANDAFLDAFRRFAARAAAVVFEHPYLASLARLLPPRTPVVYSALNVESRLKADLLRNRRDGALRSGQVEAIERQMVDRANLIVCVSDEDCEWFQRLAVGRPCVVIENGARSIARTRRESPRATTGARRALGVFMGSAHPPNVEAARFLIDVVAPAIPSFDIVLVGSVSAALGARPLPSNVHRIGIVTEAAKNALLERADVALNPMFQGGGSSLKVPDFFAAELPLVSTRLGVRGYRVRSGEHYAEAERDSFVARVREVLASPTLRETLARNARRYAEEHLDWRVLGSRYRRAIDELIGGMPRPRVLAVTYRLADPPPGGAETFLVNVLRELERQRRVVVDVATSDVGTIADHWHFSARYAPPANTSRGDSATVFRFAIEGPAPEEFARCRRLFSLWMRETRQQARMLGSRSASALGGGWNFAERGADGVRRWASREAQIFVDEATTGIRIVGYAPQATALEAWRDERMIAVRRVSARFEWEIELAPGERLLSLRAGRVHESDGDPRELGVMVTGIALREETGWRALALDEDFETEWRRDPAAWVRSLIEVTQHRDRADDDLFFAVRGPRSQALERWLEANVESYDVVLAHGTPFAIASLAAGIAGRHGIPVVQLPHFHMEDRYYHWRGYYDMFRAAQRVIASSASVKRLFFDVIGADSIALPGGGVDPREFDPPALERGKAAFRALHRGERPFVLVLGRKTGAKLYRLAIDAVAALNRHEHRVDCVMIGPDEDAVPIADPRVFAYGAQPREVVIGALASALCLVNMSESESFGIVLLESWLAGRPVIAQRRCVAFTDLVTADGNGFLADTADDLARAIATYLGDEALAARHAGAGRLVAQAHAWSRIAAKIEDVLIAARASGNPACARKMRAHPDAGVSASGTDDTVGDGVELP